MENSTDGNILRSTFAETVYLSTILFTFLRLIIPIQIDRLFRSSTIIERLKKNTIIVLNVETIIRIVEIDLTFGKEQCA